MIFRPARRREPLRFEIARAVHTVDIPLGGEELDDDGLPVIDREDFALRSNLNPGRVSPATTLRGTGRRTALMHNYAVRTVGRRIINRPRATR